jgi:hypothetical protein
MLGDNRIGMEACTNCEGSGVGCSWCKGTGKSVTALQTNAAIEVIHGILERLPDEEARKTALEHVLKNRCRTCLDFNASGQFWCCVESRG